MARMQLAGTVINTLIDLAGQESKVGKALFLLNQARAVGEVIFNTGMANAKAVAASPLTAGMPWVAINTATAAASIANILGQTIASFKGKREGGYTGSGGDNEFADFVHRNEFVANAKAVRNATLKPFLDVIDMAQKTGTIATFNFNKALGKASGGYVAPETSPAGTTLKNDIATTDLRDLTAAINRLMQWKPKVYTEDIKKGLDNLDNIDKNSAL